MTRDDILALSPWDFDQEEIGWRSEKSPYAVVKLIEDYLKLHKDDFDELNKKAKKQIRKEVLFFHLAQSLAYAYCDETALKIAEEAIVEGNEEWNNYVRATIAFFNGDIVALKEFAEMQPERIANRDVVVELAEGLSKGKTYREIYSQT